MNKTIAASLLTLALLATNGTTSTADTTYCNANNPKNCPQGAPNPSSPICGKGEHTGNPHCAAPEPTKSPKPSESPEPTKAPKPSESPEPTKAPKPSESPEPTKSPKPSESPEATTFPKPTQTPEPTKSPEPTDNGRDHEATPSAKPSVRPTPPNVGPAISVAPGVQNLYDIKQLPATSTN